MTAPDGSRPRGPRTVSRRARAQSCSLVYPCRMTTSDKWNEIEPGRLHGLNGGLVCICAEFRAW